jgi:hypothetical protein
MARGWESKSVEDQISAREAAAEDSAHERKSSDPKREGLLLARTRTLASLQGACGSRYRAHLERVLADLDKQLGMLQ